MFLDLPSKHSPSSVSFWHTPAIYKARQENREFKVILSYVESLRPADYRRPWQGERGDFLPLGTNIHTSGCQGIGALLLRRLRGVVKEGNLGCCAFAGHGAKFSAVPSGHSVFISDSTYFVWLCPPAPFSIPYFSSPFLTTKLMLSF